MLFPHPIRCAHMTAAREAYTGTRGVCPGPPVSFYRYAGPAGLDSDTECL